MRSGPVFLPGIAALSCARLQEIKSIAAAISGAEPEQQPIIEPEKDRYERTRTTRRAVPTNPSDKAKV